MYGQTIDHRGLSAWAQGMSALIHYWTGLPSRALTAVGKGLTLAPAGTATVRLLAIQARAFAHAGNGPAALESARLARLESEAGHAADDLHDEVGGEYAFGPARLARCLATAHGMLGQADQEIAEAESAIRLYTTGPAEQRSRTVEAEAWIEVGHGNLLKGRIDAAAEALEQVFSVDPDARVEGITSRLLVVRSLIARDGRLQGSRVAQELTGRIEAFAEESAASRILALPPGQ
jgi:tetratricopeptide (TPR) repeat protein